MAVDDRTPAAIDVLRQRLETLEFERRELLAELARPQASQPAVRFNGMSDGIGAVRRAERQTEQTVEWLGND